MRQRLNRLNTQGAAAVWQPSADSAGNRHDTRPGSIQCNLVRLERAARIPTELFPPEAPSLITEVAVPESRQWIKDAEDRLLSLIKTRYMRDGFPAEYDGEVGKIIAQCAESALKTPKTTPDPVPDSPELTPDPTAYLPSILNIHSISDVATLVRTMPCACPSPLSHEPNCPVIKAARILEQEVGAESADTGSVNQNELSVPKQYSKDGAAF